MHRPRPVDVQTWIADHDPLRVTAFSDPVIEQCGFDPRSPYAETYWLAVVGPTALWALRRMAAWLEAEPAGFDLPLAPLGRELGLGQGVGRHTPLVRSLARLVNFDLARVTDTGLAICRAVPPLAQRQMWHLPEHLVAAHQTAVASTPLTTIVAAP